MPAGEPVKIDVVFSLSPPHLGNVRALQFKMSHPAAFEPAEQIHPWILDLWKLYVVPFHYADTQQAPDRHVDHRMNSSSKVPSYS
jgi:hypothetical protein